MSCFQQRLKEELAYKGIITKELSEITGIRKRTLDSYLDSRKVVPPADVAVKIAKALDVSVEYLVCGKDSNSKIFSLEERCVISKFNVLDNRDKQTVLNLISFLSSRYKKENVESEDSKIVKTV